MHEMVQLKRLVIPNKEKMDELRELYYICRRSTGSTNDE
ncbi:hypothetical protein BVRB_9g209510 [Beta vulgaris subsp. vulgaris]|nr:hypothetical protein BVRB_9g209510 [Beta vulgaris subsp. vulgaris]